jgi:hypothetical protein
MMVQKASSNTLIQATVPDHLLTSHGLILLNVHGHGAHGGSAGSRAS